MFCLAAHMFSPLWRKSRLRIEEIIAVKLPKSFNFKVIELKTDPQLMGALGAAEYARQKGLAAEEEA